jgi:hypothetical protein
MNLDQNVLRIPLSPLGVFGARPDRAQELETAGGANSGENHGSLQEESYIRETVRLEVFQEDSLEEKCERKCCQECRFRSTDTARCTPPTQATAWKCRSERGNFTSTKFGVFFLE